MHLSSLILLPVAALCAPFEFGASSQNPVSSPLATYVVDAARFTVLTANVIRVEFDAEQEFEDRASIAFLNRDTPVPVHTTSDTATTFSISTDTVTLSYIKNSPFTPTSLSITSTSPSSAFQSWNYGDANTNQLPGTIRTLDMTGVISLDCADIANLTVADESYHCTMGLMSRTGHAVVVDDAPRPLLSSSTGWWSNSAHKQDTEDFYVFTHGLDFKAALSDYSLLGGQAPIPPRYALGVWFTRWINYNGGDMDAIVKEYSERSIPLDVFVLDMNWHLKNSWTGYTFDDRLFPQGGAALMSPLKELGLRIAANIHDAEGIGSYEERYSKMADAVSFDTATGENVPFLSCSNQTYAYSLEDQVLKQLEDDGMDFWWIDWQQGGDAGGCAEGVDAANPTIWLNKLRLTDKARRAESGEASKRSMVLARWGGLGNHRYQVGFSGDVDEVAWDRLAFQPYFTATAANVGFGLWSHDLVGPSDSDGEMFLRWLQWGAFSPIFRTHDRGMSSGACADEVGGCDKLYLWDLDETKFSIARRYVQERSSLMPYIYSAVRKMHSELLSLIRPMYHDFSEEEGAFDAATPDGGMAQYMFGNDMFVAPVVSKADEETLLAAKKVWMPPGQWVELEGGQIWEGAGVVEMQVALDEVPRFARCGAVIARKGGDECRTGAQFGAASEAFDELTFTIMGKEAAGGTEVYEDDGESTDYYGKEEFSLIKMKYEYEGGELRAAVSIEGTWEGGTVLADRAFWVKVDDCGWKEGGEVEWRNWRCFMKVDGEGVWSVERGGGEGVRGVVKRANDAKSLLDEAQMCPGSMTGGQNDAAALAKLASLGNLAKMKVDAGDRAGFDAVMSGVEEMRSAAREELAALLEAKSGEEGVKDATLVRIKRAQALIA